MAATLNIHVEVTCFLCSLEFISSCGGNLQLHGITDAPIHHFFPNGADCLSGSAIWIAELNATKKLSM